VRPSDGPGSRRYTFGDDAPARRRLRLLSEVLAPSSTTLLDEWVEGAPGVALDLGSGPGYSTALVAARSAPRHTVGLDQSPTFVARTTRMFPTLQFVRHDVTDVPFPTAPPDLIFARLVLAHLADPAAVARRWAGELAPGGRLLIEETEWIEATTSVLAEYETRVRAVVAHHGAPMTAGPLLASVDDQDDWRALRNTVRTIPVPVAIAARIYALNLSSWRRDPYAVEHFGDACLDELAAGLEDLATRARGQLTWGLRQLVVARDVRRSADGFASEDR